MLVPAPQRNGSHDRSEQCCHRHELFAERPGTGGGGDRCGNDDGEGDGDHTPPKERARCDRTATGARALYTAWTTVVVGCWAAVTLRKRQLRWFGEGIHGGRSWWWAESMVPTEQVSGERVFVVCQNACSASTPKSNNLSLIHI